MYKIFIFSRRTLWNVTFFLETLFKGSKSSSKMGEIEKFKKSIKMFCQNLGIKMKKYLFFLVQFHICFETQTIKTKFNVLMQTFNLSSLLLTFQRFQTSDKWVWYFHHDAGVSEYNRFLVTFLSNIMTILICFSRYEKLRRI